MKFKETSLNPAQIRIVCSCSSYIEDMDPNANVFLEDGKIVFHFTPFSNIDIVDLDNAVGYLEGKLDKDMPCRCSVSHDGSDLKVHVHSFWEGDIPHNSFAMRKAVLHATRNSIPEDVNLKKQLKTLHNFKYCPREIDDGVGIRADMDDHSIDFKVEVVEYDYTVCGAIPRLWIAHGCINGYHVELLAGSEAHAFAKIIKAFYKHANQTNGWLASQIYNNKIPWHSYGYCY